MNARPPIERLRLSLGWLVAAVVLVAPLAPTMHLLSRAHHLCPTHGVIEHGAARAVADEGEPHVAAGAVLSHGDRDADTDHEACAALATLEQARPAARVASLQLLTATPLAPETRTFTARAGPALLQLAPKTSPPPA